MKIDFRHNIREVERSLSDTALRELPYVLSLALNQTGERVKRFMPKILKRRLDRPTPFTLKAFRVRRSTKRRLRVTVFALPKQAAYLSTLEDGGTRRPRARALVTPAKIRLNKYGNVPRGGLGRAAAKNAFSGVPRGGRGGPGIYQRMGRGGRAKLRKLVSFVDRARYLPTLNFRRDALKVSGRWFPKSVARMMDRVLRAGR